MVSALSPAGLRDLPRELDQSALIDGASPMRVFFHVIFPLLRSVAVTVIVMQSVVIFDDFTNPLYFLPGDQNATMQLPCSTSRARTAR